VPARIDGAGSGEAAARALLRLDEVDAGFTPTATLTTSAGVRIEFDLSGAIDVAAERARLAKELAAAEKEQAVNAGKLGNDSFIGKAPEPVVAKVRDRLAAAEADIARVRAAMDALPPS
jgi:valyl-tRNA synthetase